MSEKKWTKGQWQSITASGGTILVSAAAGSGKTAVLIERIVRKIIDETNPVNIDDLLVVTFTKAAAAEMKQRLSLKLSQLMAENPANLRLRRQQLRLQNAHISTVHGFCSSLIRENFHMLGISPQFKLADDAEQKILKQDAAEEILEKYYAKNDQTFLQLASLLGSRRNDFGLVTAILRIYDFIQSHPFPDAWLKEHLQDYQNNQPISETAWGNIVLNAIEQKFSYAYGLLRQAFALMKDDEKLMAAYGSAISSDIKQVESILELIRESCWNDIYAALQNIQFERLGALRKYEDENKKELVKALRESAKSTCSGLCEMMCGSEEECREDVAELSSLVTVLFAIVSSFSEQYANLKQQKNLLDFNDLEHYALALLIERTDDGALRRSPLAVELSSHFAEIMVDEYQDTNAAQDALFQALSKEESNLFMVGDVKQSIYGFRQAMPELFIRRRNLYQPFDDTYYPATISLDNNFRSRSQVTDTVNFVFRQIMTKDSCGIAYAGNEELVPSAIYPEQTGCETCLTIINGKARDELEQRDEVEAAEIARQIKQLLLNYQVTDAGELRPLRYSDICILLRNKSSHATAYCDMLNRMGIPSWTSSAGGLFAAKEITELLSLLRLIDNPMLEVPLLAVMLSPAFSFSADDVAEIRACFRKVPLYVSLGRYAGMSPQSELSVRCADFLREMEQYRSLAATLPVDKLIYDIMEKLDYLIMAQARKNGEQRVANLRYFYDIARRFENDGFRGLSAFISYIDRMQQQKMDFSPASTQTEQSNVVRIMSIHNSKGLEFPIVFLAGMGSRFNTDSTKGSLLLHAEQGVGMYRRDNVLLKDMNTLPRQAVSLSIQNSERAEELRVLYVAMTRAREKLCMVMTLDNPTSNLTGLASNLTDSELLSPFQILSAIRMSDWVLSAALRHPSGLALRKLANREDLTLLPCEHPWEICIVDGTTSEEVVNTTYKELPPADDELVNMLYDRTQYVYPYHSFSQLPAKYAASQIQESSVDLTNMASMRPRFISKKGLTPAERGTALHTFMQFADFYAAETDIKQEINRLITNQFITQQQGDCLDVHQIKRFFSSSLYQSIKNAANSYREWHFALDIPASEFLQDSSSSERTDEIILIQGIADCIFEQDDGYVIVDYKTDHVQSENELIERYRQQLRMYKQAVEKIMQKPVSGVFLYSFALGHEIKLL